MQKCKFEKEYGMLNQQVIAFKSKEQEQFVHISNLKQHQEPQWIKQKSMEIKFLILLI